MEFSNLVVLGPPTPLKIIKDFKELLFYGICLLIFIILGIKNGKNKFVIILLENNNFSVTY